MGSFQAEEVYLQIAERMRTLRESSGLSQKDVADALGLTRATVNAMEAGKQRIQLHVVLPLAELFGVPFAEFLPAVGEKKRGEHAERLNQLYAEALQKHLELWTALSRSFDTLVDLHVKYVKATREL